jgi:penicillin amidase
LHATRFLHYPFDHSGNSYLRRFFDGKRVPIPGSTFSIDAASYSFDEAFESEYGVALRMVVDVSNWDNASAVLMPGQSQHLFHPNRQDQLSLWQAVEYHAMPFSRQAVEENARDALILVPPE